MKILYDSGRHWVPATPTTTASVQQTGSYRVTGNGAIRHLGAKLTVLVAVIILFSNNK